MSDGLRAPRWALVLGAALAFAAPAPGALVAQTPAQLVAQFRARLVSTLRNVRIAKDSVDSLNALARRQLPPDSVVVGAIRVRYDARDLGPATASALQAAAMRAWSAADTEFGSAARDAVGAAPIVVRRSRYLVGRVLGVGSVSLSLTGQPQRATSVGPPLTATRLEDAILNLVGTAATARVSHGVVAWAGYWTPSRRVGQDQWEDAALDLTTSSSSVTRTCYAGSVPACESALGLTDVDDPLTEWYAPEGWRVLVGTWQPPREYTALVAAHDDCVVKRVMATCERLARTRPVPVPLSAFTRTTLMGLALERGGPSAYARLMNATGTPLEVLGITAGVAPDSLVNEWRSRVLAAVPRSAAPRPAEITALVAWSVLFAVAAAGRRPS